MFILLFIGSAIGSIGFRLRGSPVAEWWFNRGIGTGRLLWWATPLTLWALFLGFPLLWAPLLFAALFIGSTLGWMQAIDLGRDASSWLADALRLAFRGFFWFAPVSIVFFLATISYWWLPMLASLLFVIPAYELGIRWWQSRWRFPHMDPENRWISSCEIIYGALLGLFFTLTLLL